LSIEIRAANPSELPALQRSLSTGFLSDYDEADQGAGDPLAETLDLGRTRCAFEDGQVVGTLGAYDLDFAVPGANVATAGTTMITVSPTHRRLGLLRRMMQAHFEQIQDAGESLAALWASEASIYPRFGYGWAADSLTITINSDHGEFRSPLEARGRVRLVEADEAAKLLPEIYEANWRERPGHFARSDAWWKHRRLRDRPAEREGGTALRFAIYEEDRKPLAYLQFRLKSRWARDSQPAGEVRIIELCAPGSAARAALWRFALDIDLTTKVVAYYQPVDSEIPWLLVDSRRALRAPRDSVFVRVLDPRRALASRRYSSEGSIVLELRDDSWPQAAGRFLLEVGPDGSSCAATQQTADLVLDASDLGAIYLGGRSLRMLGRAGRIDASAAALARGDAIFAWDPLPWCPEIF
jgi:predicted acetyltransferase